MAETLLDRNINLTTDAFVKVVKDGEWTLLFCRSGGVETTLSLTRELAFAVANALTPELRNRFDKWRAANDALYHLNYPKARAEQLRLVAREVDCDRNTCQYASSDMGGLHCDKFHRRGEFCGAIEADELIELAGALELKASLTPAPEGDAP